jgi:hypothetical protein
MYLLSDGAAHFQAVLFVTVIQHIIRITEDTLHNRAELWWDDVIYTTDKHCYKLFALSVCNSQAGSCAREFALHHILVGDADGNALWRMQWPFQEAGSVIPMPHVNAVCSWTVQTPANEGTIYLQLWNKSSGDLLIAVGFETSRSRCT